MNPDTDEYIQRRKERANRRHERCIGAILRLHSVVADAAEATALISVVILAAADCYCKELNRLNQSTPASEWILD